MSVCYVMNCRYNHEEECEENIVVDSDGYCETKNIDDSKCSICGANYINTIINDNLEHFGTPCREKGWACPNGCED